MYPAKHRRRPSENQFGRPGLSSATLWSACLAPAYLANRLRLLRPAGSRKSAERRSGVSE